MINKKINNISKMLKVSFLLSFILINVTNVFATNYKYNITPEYIKSFGGNNDDWIASVIHTDDNGFIAVGGVYSTDLNEIINKGYSDAIIVKSDQNGNQQWIKSFGGNNKDRLKSVIKTKDKGFLVIGDTSSTNIDGIVNKGYSDAIIAKYDKDGNQQWIKSFGGNDYDWFNSVIQTNDEGFIIVGETYSTNIDSIINKGYCDAIIVKYDKNGNQEWLKSLGGNGEEWFNSITQTKDKGFLVIGDTSSTNIDGIVNKGYYDAIIAKYDENGNPQWIKSFGGNDEEGFNSIVQANDGGFIVAGTTASTNIEGVDNKGYSDAIIAKYDKDGNQQWIKSFGGNDYDWFNSVIQTNDEGFIIVGETYSTNIDSIINKGYCDAIIVKYDKNGNQEWLKSFGGNDEECVYSIIMIADNEFIIVGETYSTNIEGLDNKGGSDAFIVKFTETKTIIPEQASTSLNLEIVADNSLEMSISTNKIFFEGYNGVEDLNNDKLNLTVSSGLYYDLYATLDSEIRGTNDTNAIIDKANLKIKTFDDTEYKSFVNIGEKVNIVANHINGKDFVHNINLKLLKDSSVKADTYNTNITFEVIQK